MDFENLQIYWRMATFCSKTPKIFGHLGQKWTVWPKVYILVESRHFSQKIDILLRIAKYIGENLLKHFGQKSTFWSKNLHLC